jgi:hypothetical protein
MSEVEKMVVFSWVLALMVIVYIIIKKNNKTGEKL